MVLSPHQPKAILGAGLRFKAIGNLRPLATSSRSQTAADPNGGTHHPDLSRVRRNLFGVQPADHPQTQAWLSEKLHELRENLSDKWSFDFATGKPRATPAATNGGGSTGSGPWEWTPVPTGSETPDFGCGSSSACEEQSQRCQAITTISSPGSPSLLKSPSPRKRPGAAKTTGGPLASAASARRRAAASLAVVPALVKRAQSCPSTPLKPSSSQRHGQLLVTDFFPVRKHASEAPHASPAPSPLAIKLAMLSSNPSAIINGGTSPLNGSPSLKRRRGATVSKSPSSAAVLECHNKRARVAL